MTIKFVWALHENSYDFNETNVPKSGFAYFWNSLRTFFKDNFEN